jgi:hypothetical protein
MTTSGLETARSAAEDWLVRGLRRRADAAGTRPGWRYARLDNLLLDLGRLFTAAPWPGGGGPPGELGRCFVESVSWAWASDGELAYVEGWASDAVDFDYTAHAWCAGADDLARDTTWPRPGLAYLGLPVRADAAKDLMLATCGPLLHGSHGLISELAERWLREGVPEGLLVDVGRRVPET